MFHTRTIYVIVSANKFETIFFKSLFNSFGVLNKDTSINISIVAYKIMFSMIT